MPPWCLLLALYFWFSGWITIYPTLSGVTKSNRTTVQMLSPASVLSQLGGLCHCTSGWQGNPGPSNTPGSCAGIPKSAIQACSVPVLLLAPSYSAYHLACFDLLLELTLLPMAASALLASCQTPYERVGSQGLLVP